MEEEMSSLYGSTVEDYPPHIAQSLSAAFDVEPETIVATLLAVSGQTPVGHCGLRRYPPDSGTLDVLEVKKVFVRHSHRGRGISRILMENLEVAARELGSTRLVLQTGTLQPAAIALYEGLEYSLTAPYSPFEAMPNALCYEKAL